MSENDAQEHLVSPPFEGRERSEEEAGQRRQDGDGACQPRHEKIRLVTLGVGLFALLAGFLLFLFSGMVFPLFVTTVVALLGYRRLDAWLDTAGRSRPTE